MANISKQAVWRFGRKDVLEETTDPLEVNTGMRPLTSAHDANSELRRLETEDWHVDEIPDKRDDAPPSAATAVDANARAAVTVTAVRASILRYRQGLEEK